MKVVNTNLIYKWKGDGKLSEIQCKVPLKTKYNLIAGLSATGKSTLEHLLYSTLNKSVTFDLLDLNKNKWLIVVLYAELINSDVSEFDVVFVAESVSRHINNILMNHDDPNHTVLSNKLKEATCKFLFISRSMIALPIDYKSVFEIVNYNDIDVVQSMYNSSYTFVNSKRYVIEDSTTGYEYYDYHFKNVVSSHGRDNLTKVCQSGDTVIADGSALGNNRILRRSDISLYLPESFEYDLANAWRPNDPVVKNYFRDMPDYTESVEQYFENVVLPDLCIQNHLPRYSKDKRLNDILLNVKIHRSPNEAKAIEFCNGNIEELERYASMASESKCRELNVTTVAERAYVALKALGKI